MAVAVGEAFGDGVVGVGLWYVVEVAADDNISTPDPSPLGRGAVCFVAKNRFIMRRIAMIGIVLLIISVPFQWLYLGNYVVSSASTLIAIYGILRYINKLA